MNDTQYMTKEEVEALVKEMVEAALQEFADEIQSQILTGLIGATPQAS